MEVLPDILDMEPAEAIRHLMEFWGLDEAEAEFELALARGEIDGTPTPSMTMVSPSAPLGSTTQPSKVASSARPGYHPGW